VIDQSPYAGSCPLCGAAPRSIRAAASREHWTAARRAHGSGRVAQARTGRGKREAMPQGATFVIEAGWVLSRRDDRPVLLRDASILVRDSLVAEVSEQPIRGQFARVRLPNDLVLPGFISGHTHVCSGSPTRGLIESGRFFGRPLEVVDDILSDEEIEDLTAYNLAEIVRGGCTTQVEMSRSVRQAEAYVKVAERWGVRGFPGAMVPGARRLYGVWFRNSDRVLIDSVPGTLAEIAEAHAFARRRMHAAEGRIVPMIALHATDTHTPETMRAALAASRDLGTGLHIHLAQSAHETDTVQRLWGKTPVEWLDELGFYRGIVFGVHMSGARWPGDIEPFRRGGAVYSHCPSGGGAGGGGHTQPYPEAIAAGWNVNIGIDTHSNDYLENLKLAVLYGRVRHDLIGARSPVPLVRPTVMQAVEGATIVAARGLRRDDLGKIVPGAKADLIAVDVSGFHVGGGTRPPEPLNNLLYASGRSVRHVVIDGTFVVFDGRLTVDDEAAVIARGGAAAEKVWAQLESEGWFRS
jgi:cytosine/adenosine deaminase-related metal-dependent hydrolase